MSECRNRSALLDWGKGDRLPLQHLRLFNARIIVIDLGVHFL